MISVTTSGSFDNTEKFLKRMNSAKMLSVLSQYGNDGVKALASATPIDTGLTASSWDFKVSQKNGIYTIAWINTNVKSGIPVAILLQYGHGTGTGGYVQGRDYINPAIQPIFDRIAADVWKVVTSS